jgi:hypothetical protein
MVKKLTYSELNANIITGYKDEIKNKNDDTMLDLSEYSMTLSSLQYVDWNKAGSKLFNNIYYSFLPQSSLINPKFDLSTAYKHKT